MNRRRFLNTLTAGAALAALPTGCHTAEPGLRAAEPKPIQGSWLSIWWDDRRHEYWNETCRKFTAEQWQLAVKDAADVGLEYLVLLAIAKSGKAFYDTPLLPKLEMGCADPIAALLTGADKYGVKFFISSDWYGDWDYRALLDPERMRQRFQMMEEVATRYARHRSFHGWYWPNEACLTPYFTDQFVEHVNACSAQARQLTPKAKTLIAPYGTRTAVCDDRYVRQLEQIDVNVIAYQDEVGCLRMDATASGEAFARLRQAHDRVRQRALWADVEAFAWEGPPNRQTSPLIPAPFDRLLAQLNAVSPCVDNVLIYQFQGLMNRPGSHAFAGHPDSVQLYQAYLTWLRACHPEEIRTKWRG